jgi:hypothetical protein
MLNLCNRPSNKNLKEMYQNMMENGIMCNRASIPCPPLFGKIFLKDMLFFCWIINRLKKNKEPNFIFFYTMRTRYNPVLEKLSL